MAKAKPVHLMHHRVKPYTHSYCGFVNFSLKWPWSFSRQLKQITCKRCLASISADGGKAQSFDAKLALWAEKIKKAAAAGRLPK